MNILIKHAGVPANDALDRRIEEHLFGLADALRIEQAEVQIERRWNGDRPYRVAIHLVTPGPDVRVEGADQTALAAVRKALRALDTDLRRRATRRSGRVKTNLQAPPLGRQGLRKGRPC